MYVRLSSAITSISYDSLSPQSRRLNIKNSCNCCVLISHSRNKTAVRKAAYFLSMLPHSTNTLTSKVGVPKQKIKQYASVHTKFFERLSNQFQSCYGWTDIWTDSWT